MKYTAKLGGKWKIQPFSSVPLKLEHTSDILPAIVTFKSSNEVFIYTDLNYNVGQTVSLGGYPINGKKFNLIEVSITDFPLVADAYITEKEEN